MLKNNQFPPLLGWKLSTTVFMLLVVFAVVFTFILAQTSYCLAMDKTLSYQARLMDSNGSNVSNGYYTVTFNMYTGSSGGSSFWSETQTLYATDGYISANLGALTPLNTDFSSSEYFLGVKVGTDSEMSPRKRLGASPWSVNASDSQSLQGKSPGTGSNNILQLNQWGEIDISGKISSGGGLNISSGDVNLPGNSIQTAYIANDAINADKLSVAAIDSNGKIVALNSTYLADLDGSNLTGVVATNIADGVVTNAKVNVAAAIAYSKLNLAASIQGSDLAANIAINTSGNVTVAGTFDATGAFQLNSVAVSSSATELNVLDGMTSSTTELNVLTGMTASTAELNVLDGITASTAELNTLDGYTGNVNDLNVISGGAAAGVTSTEYQYLNGVTSAIQGQLDARLALAGGTMAGNIIMGDNSVTGIDTLTFTDTAGTIAAIQNQNLLDKSAVEIVSGAWTFSDNITIADTMWIGVSGTEARIEFNEAGDYIQVQDVTSFGAETFSVISNIAMNDTTSIGLLGATPGNITFALNGAAQDSLTVDDSVFVIDDALRGTANWTNQETGAWTNANPSTITVTVTNMVAGDLVLITPIMEKAGDGDYWVVSGAGSQLVLEGLQK